MLSKPATVSFRALALLCVALAGQLAAQTEPALPVRQELNRAALQHLRDGEPGRALKTLEAAADAGLPLSLIDEDALSPACAGLHRALTQLSSDEQFELLHQWSLPAGAPPKIRVLTALVPTVVPPAEFARALGERPRAMSFPVASIGEVRGLFSTAWSLVAAAKESGKLKRLMTELGPLVDKQVSHADLLLALAQMADDRGDLSKPADLLSERNKQLQASLPTTGPGQKTIDPSNIVLAATALQQPTLRPLGEQLFETLTTATYGQPASRIRPFLRQAHATAVLRQRSDADSVSLLAPRLKYWVPVSGSNGADAVWLTHEDHLLHLSGSGNDALLFRYPLQGNFQFQCETQTGGRVETDGGLAYGGLFYQAQSSNSEFSVWDAGGAAVGKLSCPFLRYFGRPTFNRLSITSTPNTVSVAVNQHPMWTDHAAFPASPWLGLRSLDERRPLFRNLKLTGQPVILRAVHLSDGNALRGWHAPVFGQLSPPPTPTTGAAVSSGWRLIEGVLQAPDDKPDAPLEHLLSYQRPLLAGEAVNYEFSMSRASMKSVRRWGASRFCCSPMAFASIG